MPLTPQQETAVYDRGGSLLVSAAAGSGKTKVLVERLFSYMEQEGCQVDDFLIITYTKAAAAELRGKIAQELTRRVADRPGDGHLRRQMLRVYQADIKTVDAFCAGLLRENVHLLPPVEEHSLTPDFRVLDEQEAMLLRRRCWIGYWRIFTPTSRRTATPASWRRPWEPDGMTGRWRPWCWTSTKRPRATRTPCGGWSSCGRAGRSPPRSWRTPAAAGISWRTPCAGRTSGPGG